LLQLFIASRFDVLLHRFNRSSFQRIVLTVRVKSKARTLKDLIGPEQAWPSRLLLMSRIGIWWFSAMIEPVVVIVAYRPKPGRESETLDLVRSRVPTLRKQGLVTDRTSTIMRARDGTIIEVSEWKSQEAIEAAHKNPNVLAMWNRFFEVCDCAPLNTLSESAEMFAGLEPIPD